MFTYIDRLRQKPESTRRRFAFIFSGVVVLVIGLCTYGGYLYTQDPQTALSTNSTPSPLKSIAQSIKDSFASSRESMKTTLSAVPPQVNVEVATSTQNDEVSSGDSVIITDTPAR